MGTGQPLLCQVEGVRQVLVLQPEGGKAHFARINTNDGINAEAMVIAVLLKLFLKLLNCVRWQQGIHKVLFSQLKSIE